MGSRSSSGYFPYIAILTPFGPALTYDINYIFVRCCSLKNAYTGYQGNKDKGETTSTSLQPACKITRLHYRELDFQCWECRQRKIGPLVVCGTNEIWMGRENEYDGTPLGNAERDATADQMRSNKEDLANYEEHEDEKAIEGVARRDSKVDDGEREVGGQNENERTRGNEHDREVLNIVVELALDEEEVLGKEDKEPVRMINLSIQENWTR